MLTTPVSEYMTREPTVIPVGANLETAAKLLDARGVSAMPVVDGDRIPVGVVSRRDLLRAGFLTKPEGRAVAEWRLPDRPVEGIMTREILAVAPTTALGEAAALMLDKRAHRVFVEEDKELHGVLTTRDIMKAIVDARLDAPLEGYMHRPVESIVDIGPLAFARKRLDDLDIRGLIVAWDGRPVGVFAEEQALASREVDPDTPVSQVMSHQVIVESPDVPLHLAAGRMASMHAQRVVVMKGDEMLGVLTGFDLAGAAALQPE
ncbi:MAG: hypothetical protein DRJ42_26180 [Deltaproteobacteria bacterium]|nr:MAG: hypothetical protein DRJ42_26180 [Deltaproteobacteria bacterium]